MLYHTFLSFIKNNLIKMKFKHKNDKIILKIVLDNGDFGYFGNILLLHREA